MRYLQILCLLLILAVGMFLRIGTAEHSQVDHPVRADARDYVAYAWNLKSSGVYSPDSSRLVQSSIKPPVPDAARTPGYPWFLRTLLDQRVDAGFIARVADTQAWIAGVTLLCSTLLAMELLGAWPGLAAGALVAVSPHQSVYVSYLLTETLYGAVLILALGVAVLALKSCQPRWRYLLAGIAGVLFGFACLVRPTLNQLLPVLFILLPLPFMRDFRGSVLACTFGFVLMMSPWWIRNELALHETSDSTRMLLTVQQGSYPDFMYEGRPETYGYPYRFDPNAAESESNWGNVFADLRAKFAHRPADMIEWYLFGKLAYFFRWSSPERAGDIFIYPVLQSPWVTEPAFIVIASITHGMYLPLIICGVIGTLIAFLPRTRVLFGSHQANGIRMLALLHLFVIGVHVAGAPFARYSVPFRPVTFLLSIFLITWLVRNYAAHTQSSSTKIIVEQSGF